MARRYHIDPGAARTGGQASSCSFHRPFTATVPPWLVIVHRLGALLRRYGLLLVWLAFGVLTANAARNPGFVAHPETAPYPWRAALATWAILGLESAVFYLIARSRRRLRFAFALAALLFVGDCFTIVTDMPGYYYMPCFYQLALTLWFGIAWGIHALTPMPQPPGPGPTAS